ncbi:MAG: hypothetical protein HQL01_15725 [Nitrospirae bacterium]|nr:hypothetical protein [Nitrospirota bacterium]
MQANCIHPYLLTFPVNNLWITPTKPMPHAEFTRLTDYWAIDAAIDMSAAYAERWLSGVLFQNAKCEVHFQDKKTEKSRGQRSRRNEQPVEVP